VADICGPLSTMALCIENLGHSLGLSDSEKRLYIALYPSHMQTCLWLLSICSLLRFYYCTTTWFLDSHSHLSQNHNNENPTMLAFHLTSHHHTYSLLYSLLNFGFNSFSFSFFTKNLMLLFIQIIILFVM